MEQIPQQPSDDGLNRADAIISMLLMLMTLVLYHQVFHFDYLRVDDPQYVSQNWHVLSGLSAGGVKYAMTAVVSSNWHPVTLLVEMLVVQLLGSTPAVFHGLCAALHAANVALLFIFLRLTTRSQFKALLVAVLWGWHPLRVESVAWVGELKDVLCGFFWLLTMLAFANYRRHPSPGFYLLVLLSATLALLSKPMAVTLPAALFLLNFWPLKQPGETVNLRWLFKRFVEQLPLLALSFATAVVSIRTQSAASSIGTLDDFPMSLRITNALYSYLRYVGKEFVPVHMGLIYPHPATLHRTVPAVQWIAGSLFIALVTAAALRVRQGKPWLLVNWLWFVGCLIPVIGLVQVGQAAMADRYTYLPGIGFTVIVVWLAADLLLRVPTGPSISGILAVAVACTLIGVTLRQISFWRDSITLMAHSNQVIPDDYLAQSSLALSEASAGRVSQAIAYGQSAVNIAPWNQEAHHALAMAYAADHRIPDAIREDSIAIRRDPGHPGLWIDLGHLLVKQNRFAEARKAFSKALDLDPDLLEARHDLAGTLALLGDLDAAIAQWRIVLQQSPTYAQAHGDLADALRLKNDLPGAVEHYRAALAAGSKNPAWESELSYLVATNALATPAEVMPLVAVAKDAVDQTRGRDAGAQDAYAACLARTNQFELAINAAREGLADAASAHQAGVAAGIQRRLALYEKYLPYVVGAVEQEHPVPGILPQQSPDSSRLPEKK